MRPWLNATDNSNSLMCSGSASSCFNEAVAQRHGQLAAPPVPDDGLDASMRPWLNATDNGAADMIPKQFKLLLQ